MVDNIEYLKDSLVDAQGHAASPNQDKQTHLLRLAERTVLQAEILAQEITERAKQESEALAAKTIEETTARAREELRRAETQARELTERARRESEAEAARIRDESKTQAQEEARRIIEGAEQQSATMTSEARASAQWESQEILATAQQEAITLTIESKARAAAIESEARSKAEFIVRMTQNVAEGIKRAIAETCGDSLEPSEGLESGILDKHVSGLGQEGRSARGDSRDSLSARRKARTVHGHQENP